MEETNKIKKIIISTIIFIFGISCLGGLTYAFFSVSLSGTGSQGIVTTGSLSLVYYDGSNDIVASGWRPTSTYTKTFTVTNSGTAATRYNLYWLDVINTFAVQNEIRYTLESETTGSNTPPELNDIQVPDTTSKQVMSSNILINPQEVHTYHLTIEFIETGSNQNSNQGGTFEGKVYIDEGLVNLYSYTGEYQVFTAPKAGLYQIELWGASAGGSGKGAYTSGTISLSQNQTLYVYVGQKITTANVNSYNGGYGNSGGYPGGGATDVRLISGLWDENLSLNSRIMVAAGAGSGSGNTTVQMGSGGGLTGYNGGTACGGSASNLGYGSNQTEYSTITVYTSARFGVGGGGCGGGGGFYGGTGANCTCGGGGGSSYISGHTGCVAIASASDTNAKRTKRTGTGGAACLSETSDNLCSVHTSGLTFGNTVMIDGAGFAWTNTKESSPTAMPNPTGGYYALNTGNNGNGYARIAYLSD